MLLVVPSTMAPMAASVTLVQFKPALSVRKTPPLAPPTPA
jgi:hypothetical protein